MLVQECAKYPRQHQNGAFLLFSLWSEGLTVIFYLTWNLQCFGCGIIGVCQPVGSLCSAYGCAFSFNWLCFKSSVLTKLHLTSSVVDAVAQLSKLFTLCSQMTYTGNVYKHPLYVVLTRIWPSNLNDHQDYVMSHLTTQTLSQNLTGWMFFQMTFSTSIQYCYVSTNFYRALFIIAHWHTMTLSFPLADYLYSESTESYNYVGNDKT